MIYLYAIKNYMNLIIAFGPFLIGLLLLLFNAFSFLILRSKTLQTKILGYYLTASFIEGTACFGLYFVFPENNFFISHIFFIIQLLFLSYFFYNVFENKITKQIVKFFSVALLVVFILQYAITPSNFFKFNLYEVVSICVLLITFSLVYVYNNLGKSKKYLYFSFGVVIYFTCTCFVYLLGGYTIVLCQNPFIDHWIIKDVFFIIFQLLVFKECTNLKFDSTENN